MRADIAVDNWKLPVFRKKLREAGYLYEDGGALAHDATLLTVETFDLPAFKRVIEACQSECRSAR